MLRFGFALQFHLLRFGLPGVKPTGGHARVRIPIGQAKVVPIAITTGDGHHRQRFTVHRGAVPWADEQQTPVFNSGHCAIE
ncbi:hypothetical protein D3C72_2170380 [compost metagenome]